MAFEQENLSPIGAHASNSPNTYTYSTDDSVSEVTTAGYFTDKKFQFEVGDIIFSQISGTFEILEVINDDGDVSVVQTGGGGDVVGTPPSTVGNIPQFTNTGATGISDSGFSPSDFEQVANKNQANGYVGLNASGFIDDQYLPTSVVNMQGTFGSAGSTTGGDLPSSGNTSGDAYTCDTDDYASTEAGITFDSGDVALYDTNGNWIKLIDQGIKSFNGRTARDVVPTTSDYDSDQVDNASTVSGTSVSDALEQLNTAIGTKVTSVQDGLNTSVNTSDPNNPAVDVSITSALDMQSNDITNGANITNTGSITTTGDIQLTGAMVTQAASATVTADLHDLRDSSGNSTLTTIWNPTLNSITYDVGAASMNWTNAVNMSIAAGSGLTLSGGATGVTLSSANIVAAGTSTAGQPSLRISNSGTDGEVCDFHTVNFDPDDTLTAFDGSVCFTRAGTSSNIYVRQAASGSGNTGWIPVLPFVGSTPPTEQNLRWLNTTNNQVYFYNGNDDWVSEQLFSFLFYENNQTGDGIYLFFEGNIRSTAARGGPVPYDCLLTAYDYQQDLSNGGEITLTGGPYGGAISAVGSCTVGAGTNTGNGSITEDSANSLRMDEGDTLIAQWNGTGGTPSNDLIVHVEYRLRVTV